MPIWTDANVIFLVFTLGVIGAAIRAVYALYQNTHRRIDAVEDKMSEQHHRLQTLETLTSEFKTGLERIYKTLETIMLKVERINAREEMRAKEEK